MVQVNNPYYIGDPTQIICVARIQIYIGCFAMFLEIRPLAALYIYIFQTHTIERYYGILLRIQITVFCQVYKLPIMFGIQITVFSQGSQITVFYYYIQIMVFCQKFKLWYYDMLEIQIIVFCQKFKLWYSVRDPNYDILLRIQIMVFCQRS